MRMRPKPLDQIDPQRAWQPWRPDSIRPFDVRWAGHLFRRAAFGGTPDELRQAVKDGLDATLNRLLKGDPAAAAFEPVIASSGASIAAGGDENDLRGWWLYVMLHSGHPLREKLTLFWHNHFATSIAKVRATTAMWGQNQTLRKHALGSFRAMLADVSRDPAMLIWLDSNRNVRGQPNENYARELMELFTLGIGRYTESDVREAARAFTGWHTDGDRFRFAPRFHDGGRKTVLGQAGPWTGDEVQRIVLSQPAAGLFLARKLYRAFISESTEPPDALLEPLAESLRTSDFDIGRTVAMVLRSQHFFSEHAYRQRIKSPVEHVLGIVRIVRPATQPRELIRPLEQMGQALFAPPNVKGWPGGKAWLNSATMLARQNFAQAMIGETLAAPAPPAGTPAPTDPPAADVALAAPAPHPVMGQAAPFIAWIAEQNLASPAALVDLVTDALLQADVLPAERQRLIDFAAAGNPQGAQREQRIAEVAHAVMSLPEFALA